MVESNGGRHESIIGWRTVITIAAPIVLVAAWFFTNQSEILKSVDAADARQRDVIRALAERVNNLEREINNRLEREVRLVNGDTRSLERDVAVLTQKIDIITAAQEAHNEMVRSEYSKHRTAQNSIMVRLGVLENELAQRLLRTPRSSTPDPAK